MDNLFNTNFDYFDAFLAALKGFNINTDKLITKSNINDNWQYKFMVFEGIINGYNEIAFIPYSDIGRFEIEYFSPTDYAKFVIIRGDRYGYSVDNIDYSSGSFIIIRKSSDFSTRAAGNYLYIKPYGFRPDPNCITIITQVSKS